MLLTDLISQEQLCIDKYKQHASEATDPNLKTLFSQLEQKERTHHQTLSSLSQGTIPSMSGGEPSAPVPQAKSAAQGQAWEHDKYLCSDALGTEKHVSSVYNTSVFEFADKSARQVLNHIQTEEQEHGEKIFCYMSQNGMYAAV